MSTNVIEWKNLASKKQLYLESHLDVELSLTIANQATQCGAVSEIFSRLCNIFQCNIFKAV